MRTYPNGLIRYLRTLLEFEEQGVDPIRARLAERLGHSMPSTCQATSKLELLGLATLDRDCRSVSLTSSGRQVAVTALRKHRLAETFLSAHVGLDWTLLHTEAELWEQSMSDALADLIDARLGAPRVTPYGTPIPPPDAPTWRADTHSLGLFALEEIAPFMGRQEYVLCAIGEIAQSTPGLLLALDSATLRPGSVIQAARTAHAVELRAAHATAELHVQPNAAACIQVRPAQTTMSTPELVTSPQAVSSCR